MLKRRYKSEFEWLEYGILSEIIHGTVLRQGEPRLEDIEKIFDIGPICYPCKQVHGVEIIEVSAKNIGPLPPCDALMTKEAGVPLMVRHADCQAAVFYDPVKQALAVAHCGWRGSVQNIYGAVVRRLKGVYKCRSEDLRVAISPSLGPAAAEFVNFRKELPESFWRHRVTDHHFDFWAISLKQLLELGIKDSHVEIARLCTYTNSEDYFSHRRAKDTGRHGTLACLG